MDPQALINALSDQRNSALNQAAQAIAYASTLEARLKELTECEGEDQEQVEVKD